MPSREFPAPPDLSELLKFFESDEGKARVSCQNGAVQRSRKQSSQSSFSKRPSSGSLHTATSKVWKAPPAAKQATAEARRISKSIPVATNKSEHKSVRDEKTSTNSHMWNASTQLPPAPAKTLRHQLLSRTYQPPAPVYVVPSEATELLDRLAKGTISSRSKLRSQGDPTRGGQNRIGGDERSSSGVVRPASLTDTRGRDAIQTLLFYRKEVERRRRLDTNDSRTDE